MAGIYIVDVVLTDESGETSETRSVVIADSAQSAADPYEFPNATVEVGRIGTYDPGMTGAMLAGINPDELVIGPRPR